MSKINKNFKKEFNQTISPTPLLSEKDKERFHQWVDERKLKRRKRPLHWYPKFVTAILLLSFIGTFYFTYGSNLTGFIKQNSLEKSFQDYFQITMEDKFQENYSLISQEVGIVEQDDVIAIFTAPNEQEVEQLFIGYFVKIGDEQWKWLQTREADWEDPVVWSSENIKPYIYSVVTTNSNITDVYVGDERARMMQTESEKELWFGISNKNNEVVTSIKGDGTKEIIKEIPIPDQLLSKEEGKISYLFVYPNESNINSPEFMQELNDLDKILANSKITSLESARHQYPSLDLKKEPYFMFFDTGKIIYETSDMEKANLFLKEKLIDSSN